jgi:hypothetical protein
MSPFSGLERRSKNILNNLLYFLFGGDLDKKRALELKM